MGQEIFLIVSDDLGTFHVGPVVRTETDWDWSDAYVTVKGQRLAGNMTIHGWWFASNKENTDALN